MIKPATTRDLSEITSLHLKELGNTPNSRVGSWLISKLYQLTLQQKNAKILVAKSNNKVVGVISFGYDLPRFMNTISHSFTFGELFKIIWALLSNPSALISQIQHKLFMLLAYKYLSTSYLGILTICIDTAHQGQHIGTALITEVDDFAKKWHQDIFVDTYQTNTSAIKFYQKNGYRIIYQSFGNVLLKKTV